MTIYPSRIVAYLCPNCSQLTVQRISIFDVKDNSAILTCSNPQCSLPIIYLEKRRNKYIIRIPCPICGEIHEFHTTAQKLWNDELLIYNCQNEAWNEFKGHYPPEVYGIFYIGDITVTLRSITQNHALTHLNREQRFKFKRACEIIRHLCTLVETGRVSCGCTAPNVRITSVGLDVLATCVNCGHEKLIHSDAQSRKDILNKSSLILEPPQSEASEQKKV